MLSSIASLLVYHAASSFDVIVVCLTPSPSLLPWPCLVLGTFPSGAIKPARADNWVRVKSN